MAQKLICEYCGKSYTLGSARSIFNAECPLFDYDNIRPNYCGECAKEAVFEDYATDTYFTTCTKCGREFDYGQEEANFRDMYPDLDLTGCWFEYGICCAECANEYYENYFKEHEIYDD